MKARALRANPAPALSLADALATFETARWWSIARGGCVLYAYPVRAVVRRKKGETVAAMVTRCAELFRQRRASGWAPEPRVPGEDTCNGCGKDNRTGTLRRVSRLKLTLCADCREGLR